MLGFNQLVFSNQVNAHSSTNLNHALMHQDALGVDLKRKMMSSNVLGLRQQAVALLDEGLSARLQVTRGCRSLTRKTDMIQH